MTYIRPRAFAEWSRFISQWKMACQKQYITRPEQAYHDGGIDIGKRNNLCIFHLKPNVFIIMKYRDNTKTYKHIFYQKRHISADA